VSSVTATAPVSQTTRKTITFTGAAGAGAIGQVAVATITGAVLVERVIARCTTSLTGALATLSLGHAGAVALLIPLTTATLIVSGKFWGDATPVAGGLALGALLKDVAINANITLDVLTAAVATGVLEIDFVWRPLSSDGNLA
jgi:hypothetical protein